MTKHTTTTHLQLEQKQLRHYLNYNYNLDIIQTTTTYRTNTTKPTAYDITTTQLHRRRRRRRRRHHRDNARLN